MRLLQPSRVQPNEIVQSPKHALLSVLRTRSSKPFIGRAARFGFWALPTIGLFLVTLGWTGVSGDKMNLGGDDSHLMYAYPLQWLAHASLPAVDQNLAGYNPRTFFVPFVLLIGAIRGLGLNSEGAVFGAVLALTFTGVARLTLELLQDRSRLAYEAALIAGVVSVSAPLVAETEWSNLLISIFWLPLVPWLLIFYIWHQRNGGWPLAAAAAAMIGLAASAINQFSWTIACGILLLGLGSLAALAGVYRFRPMRLTRFSAAILLVNAFWVIPVVAAPLLQQAQFTTALASEGKATAINIVRVIAPTTSAGDAIALRHSASLMQSFGWPALIPDQWPKSFGLLGLLPVLITAAGMIRAWIRSASITGYWILFGLAGLTLLFLYFETLRVLPGGVAIFEFLTRTVPGWTAERNFYDKFAIPYVEVFALLVGVSFYQLLRGVPKVAASAIALIASAGLVFYGLPFFAGAEFSLPYYLNVRYNRVMHGLPTTYLSMLDRLRELPPGAVLSLPLSTPAWTVVASESGEGVYIGISPIFFLTGRDDYNGVAAFDSDLVPFLSAIVRDDLNRGDVDALARLVGELGVKYVVVNTRDDINNDYYRVGAVNDVRLQSLETSTLVANYAPRLLGRYGSFELRELTSSLSKPVISLQSTSQYELNPAYLEGSNLGVISSRNETCAVNGIAHGSIAQDEYRLSLPPTQGACTIVLRRAFSNSWRATFSPMPPAGSHSNRIFGFANSFSLPASSQTRQVRLTYGYQDIVLVGALVSLVSVVALVVLSMGRSRKFLDVWRDRVRSP